MTDRCRCHSDPIYATLVECPRCHHWSLDRQGDWEGCERRSCGYQKVQADEQLRVGWPVAM